MEPEQKSNGALVGSIVIVLILIIGGVYMWQNRPAENALPEENNVGSTADLEMEANNIDLESLDSEL